MGEDFTDPWVETSDNADGVVKITVTGDVDTNTAGTYTLAYTATDGVGNTAAATREVKVSATVGATAGNPFEKYVDRNATHWTMRQRA